MKQTYITDIELIDQDGSVSNEQLLVTEDVAPEDMQIIRNQLTVGFIDKEKGAFTLEFFKQEDGLSMMTELGFEELGEESHTDLLVHAQKPVREFIGDQISSETGVVTSLFEDLTLKESKEFFLHTVVFAESEEEFKNISNTIQPDQEEKGSIVFDIARMVESMNVSAMINHVKNEMREKNNPTHVSDLQLEYVISTAIHLTVGGVKYIDMVAINEHKAAKVKEYQASVEQQEASEEAVE